MGGFAGHSAEISTLPEAEGAPEAGPSSGEEQQALAATFYQLKTRNCLSSQCLTWTRSRPTAMCWRGPYRTQTREHLFKYCLHWNRQ
jgi:hypothetical protein